MTHPSLRQITLRSSRRQSGVALIISMVLLTIMTLLGMAGIRAIGREERMVAQTFDRSLAMAAAESALRQGEILIENSGRPAPAPTASCSMAGSGTQVMACGVLLTATVPRWVSSSFTDWANAPAVGSGSFQITPQYFVEYLGGNFPCTLNAVASGSCKRYRVSARASAGDDRALVVVQSIYATYDP